MAGSTKLTLALVLCGLFFIVFFFWSVFLSGTPLLTEDIWQTEKSMSKNEALAWRKNPGAYKAPALELTPAMNPVAIAIAHWSRAVSFPRSSQYTLQVKNSGGETVYEGAIGLMQKKNEGGPGTTIFEWTADTASFSQLPEYLEVPGTGTYTFFLRPAGQQGGNHSRLQLCLRREVIRPQWWMVIAGFPMVFIGTALFIFSGFRRIRAVLKEHPALAEKG